MKRTANSIKLRIAGLTASLLYCGAAFALPTISNVYPNGTNMFQPSPALTFTANSGSGVTNIVVDLTATNLYTGSVLLSHRTMASGLTIVGSSVSAPLSGNTLYGASIKVYDASGSATLTEAFDTINPVYTWEAEDFDFNGGQYIETGVNQYAGLVGVSGTDYNNGNPNNGNADYRPKGLETENPNSGDSPLRLQYIGTTNRDYNVGWTARGDWANYTRHYPAGTYNIFVRVAGGGNASSEAGDINVVSGNASSTNATPYKYAVLGRGWGAYDFVPVKDSGGNLVQMTFDGSAVTLQELQVDNSDNFNFFMLMPVQAFVPSTVTITNVTPDGSVQFQASNSMSFNISSPVAIDLSSVAVQFNTTSLFGSNSASLLTIGNGLSYSGNSTNIYVTAPLASNLVYVAMILANDANGVQASVSANFDTVVPFYTFEAEDWNYNSGQFIDNPQINAYGNPNSPLDGVREIDFHRPSGATIGTYGRVGLASEDCGDVPRASHVGIKDYDNGNTSGGDWANYTRTFPAGIYNIFVRVARGNGGSVTDAGKVSLVTSDSTQPNQSLQDLGTHDTPSTGNWQKYIWMPVLNSGHYPARFVADGNPKTLRYTFDGAGDNVNFIMLIPADLSVNPPPFINGFTPDGSQLFQPSNTVGFVVNSSVGIAKSNVMVTLNGVVASGLTFSGSSTLWNVTCPVKTNMAYTAIITLSDAAGTIKYTNSFTTFYSGDYQFEAEDYDYGNGQYVDNGAPDAYAGLSGVAGVDYAEADPNGPGRSSGSPYRPANGANIPDSPAGDLPRSQFTDAGATDYNIGSFGDGSWTDYTRHYPAGTYFVMGRFGEGAGMAGANLALVKNGVSTNLLGTFTVPNLGWGTWQWQELLDGNNTPVRVALDGTAQTLRLGGTTGNEVNVNFLMLVPTAPTPTLSAAVGSGTISISFPTQNGYSYQLQYKNSLADGNWTSLGSALSGNNSVQSASDVRTGGGQRFYRVQVQ